tara:strand:+ start:7248 stop:9590 length:2343 start_codon:yes stop_codon:yes gene_type:complete
MVFSNNLLMGAAGQASGYEIDQSIRFNDDDSAFLARTPSASNRKTWTWSAWVKRADLFNGSVPQILLSAGDGGSNDFIMQFGQSDDTLRISDYISTTQSNLITTQLFRDVSAWYHFVLAYDTTQGTAANRIKLYVNGSQVTAFGTEIYPSENQDLVINSAIAHNIGRGAYSSNGYFSGYMAEINFVDGTALAPTAFGETNTNGVWVPIAYAGSYGTEGYFIDGRDSSDLGDDESGNGNDFSSSGLAAADQMSDSPTDNHSTLNLLSNGTGADPSDGNLKFSTTSSATGTMVSTIPVSSGKWYCEVTVTTGSANGALGIRSITQSSVTSNTLGNQTLDYAYRGNGQKFNSNTKASYGTAYTTNAIVGIALDLDSGTIKFLNDNSDQGNAYTGISGTFVFAVGDDNSSSAFAGTFNFGASSFTYTPPTGYKALNTANLSTPTISDGSKYFQTTLYTGNGSTQSINQSGNSTFQPDLVWVKNRSATDSNVLTDAVRGATKIISSDATSAESTDADTVTAFESDGFALGDDDKVNTSSENFVAWQWLAGNSSGSTNDDGSVDSTVTANTTAGFSICKFNPGGNSNITFGHGLGTAPRLVLVKNLEDATNWQVLHLDQGVGNKLFLNTTAAAASDTNMWQNTAPTSSVVSVGTSQTTNEQNIAYVWNEVAGYSRFRSYIGNGSTDGPFIYTGFRPALVITKNISNSGDAWPVADSKRAPFNVSDATVFWNQTTAETTGYSVDLLSNGFKPRSSDHAINESGATIIYMAWAEHPFGGDGIAPSPAR